MAVMHQDTFHQVAIGQGKDILDCIIEAGAVLFHQFQAVQVEVLPQGLAQGFGQVGQILQGSHAAGCPGGQLAGPVARQVLLAGEVLPLGQVQIIKVPFHLNQPSQNRL